MHQPTTRYPRTTLPARRALPLTAFFAMAAVAGLGLTALVLVPDPAARVGLVLVTVLGLVGVVVWFGSRARRAASELDRLVAMSDDLSRAVDAATAGDLMARHLALAARVDQSGVCYWDATTGEVLTLGYYPLERRDPVGASYRLADYTECQRALEEQVVVVL